LELVLLTGRQLLPGIAGTGEGDSDDDALLLLLVVLLTPNRVERQPSSSSRRIILVPGGRHTPSYTVETIDVVFLSYFLP
jgi:hypothetical protein